MLSVLLFMLIPIARNHPREEPGSRKSIRRWALSRWIRRYVNTEKCRSSPWCGYYNTPTRLPGSPTRDYRLHPPSCHHGEPCCLPLCHVPQGSHGCRAKPADSGILRAGTSHCSPADFKNWVRARFREDLVKQPHRRDPAESVDLVELLRSYPDDDCDDDEREGPRSNDGDQACGGAHASSSLLRSRPKPRWHWICTRRWRPTDGVKAGGRGFLVGEVMRRL